MPRKPVLQRCPKGGHTRQVMAFPCHECGKKEHDSGYRFRDDLVCECGAGYLFDERNRCTGQLLWKTGTGFGTSALSFLEGREYHGTTAGIVEYEGDYLNEASPAVGIQAKKQVIALPKRTIRTHCLNCWLEDCIWFDVPGILATCANCGGRQAHGPWWLNIGTKKVNDFFTEHVKIKCGYCGYYGEAAGRFNPDTGKPEGITVIDPDKMLVSEHRKNYHDMKACAWCFELGWLRCSRCESTEIIDTNFGYIQGPTKRYLACEACGAKTLWIDRYVLREPTTARIVCCSKCDMVYAQYNISNYQLEIDETHPPPKPIERKNKRARGTVTKEEQAAYKSRLPQRTKVKGGKRKGEPTTEKNKITLDHLETAQLLVKLPQHSSEPSFDWSQIRAEWLEALLEVVPFSDPRHERIRQALREQN